MQLVKFGMLRSIGHNIADSLASGVGFLIGGYDTDVFGEAALASEGCVEVDFLRGRAWGDGISTSLARAVVLYRDALTDLCEKHGTSPLVFQELSARYSVVSLNRRFVVVVADHHGRRSIDEYEGVPGKHVRVLDHLGRARRKSFNS
jgi:hypothetical protein